MKKSINIAIGAIFIIPGTILLLERFNIINIRQLIDFTYLIKNYWAVVGFVIPGLFLHMMFFSGKRTTPLLIMSGGTLIFIGVLSQISSMYNLWDKLWPGIITAFAFGLMEYFFYGKRERAVLIGGIIISGLSAVLFSKTIYNTYYYTDYILSIVLISLGLAVIFGNSQKKGSL